MATKREQRIDLDMTRMDMNRPQKAQLKLYTDKGSRSLDSSAMVVWVGDGFESFTIFGDFSKCLLRVKKTGTQKAIDTQHATVFTEEVIAGLVGEVKDYYQKQAAANARA